MTDFQKALYVLTVDFVDEVKRSMIDRYLMIQSYDEERLCLDRLLVHFLEETGQADLDMQKSFERYLDGDKYFSLDVTPLNHASHYRQVIVDFLQGKW
jgi:hypothetical protein